MTLIQIGYHMTDPNWIQYDTDPNVNKNLVNSCLYTLRKTIWAWAKVTSTRLEVIVWLVPGQHPCFEETDDKLTIRNLKKIIPIQMSKILLKLCLIYDKEIL